MAEKPNVTVIYQDAKPSPDDFWNTMRQVAFTAFLIGCGALLFGGCGVAWWLW